MNYLVFCAYGTDDHQNETKYAVLRFYRIASPATRESTTLVIYTDRPEAWDGFDFGPLHHEIVALPSEQFVAWKGAQGIVYRIKTEVLRHFAVSHEGLVLMMDTDTHLKTDLAEVYRAMAEGTVVMHLKEGRLAPGGEFADWHAFLQNHEIDGFRFPPEVDMWNSGVVGIHTSRVEEFATDALRWMDDLYRTFGRHNCEQLAVGYSLQSRYPLRECPEAIHHYWGFKEFRRLLREFFARRRGSLDELAAASDAVVPADLEEAKRRFKRQNPLRRFFMEITGRKWRIEDYFRFF